MTTLQIELDKTAEEFRRAHAERQDLIMQWENTIEQMQRRDAEMDLLAAVSFFPVMVVKYKYDILCDYRGKSYVLVLTELVKLFLFENILHLAISESEE